MSSSVCVTSLLLFQSYVVCLSLDNNRRLFDDHPSNRDRYRLLTAGVSFNMPTKLAASSQPNYLRLKNIKRIASTNVIPIARLVGNDASTNVIPIARLVGNDERANYNKRQQIKVLGRKIHRKKTLPNSSILPTRNTSDVLVGPDRLVSISRNGPEWQRHSAIIEILPPINFRDKLQPITDDEDEGDDDEDDEEYYYYEYEDGDVVAVSDRRMPNRPTSTTMNKVENDNNYNTATMIKHRLVNSANTFAQLQPTIVKKKKKKKNTPTIISTRKIVSISSGTELQKRAPTISSSTLASTTTTITTSTIATTITSTIATTTTSTIATTTIAKVEPQSIDPPSPPPPPTPPPSPPIAKIYRVDNKNIEPNVENNARYDAQHYSIFPQEIDKRRRCFRARRNCMPVDATVIERRITNRPAPCVMICKSIDVCNAILFMESTHMCYILRSRDDDRHQQHYQHKRLVKHDACVYFDLIDSKFCHGKNKLPSTLQ